MIHFERNQRVSVVARRDRAIVVTEKGFHRIEGVDPGSLSRALAAIGAMTDRLELEKHFAPQAIELLCELGVFIPTEMQPQPAARPLVGRLVACLSGAVGVSQMTSMLQFLRQSVCSELEVVMTHAATAFVPPRMLRQVGFSVWDDHTEVRDAVNVPHMHLAHSADVVLVMPASAHTISKLAHAACSDLVSLVCAATTAPVIVVPSMNEAMWRNPMIARNVEQLRCSGVYVVEPGPGMQVFASGAPAKRKLGPVGVTSDCMIALLSAVLHESGHSVALAAMS